MKKELVRDDFKGRRIHYPIKVIRNVTGFSSKKNDIYVSKYSGLVSVKFRRKSEEIASSWNKKFNQSKKKIFNSKKYTATVPFVKTRLINTILTADDFINLTNKRIIDLGCGEGILLQEIKEKFKCKVFGVDPSFENCRLIKKNKIKSFCSIAENFCKNKKFKDYFDVCFITWTLCNSSDCDKIVNGAYKILKKGGFLVLAESSRIMVPFKKSIFNYFTRKKKVDLHPFHFSLNSLNNLMVINNFKPVYKNHYQNNNEVILVGRKRKNVSEKYLKRDKYKSVIKFFNKWYEISKYYEKLID